MMVTCGVWRRRSGGYGHGGGTWLICDGTLKKLGEM